MTGWLVAGLVERVVRLKDGDRVGSEPRLDMKEFNGVGRRGESGRMRICYPEVFVCCWLLVVGCESPRQREPFELEL